MTMPNLSDPILIILILFSLFCLALYIKEFLHRRSLEKKDQEILEQERQKVYQQQLDKTKLELENELNPQDLSQHLTGKLDQDLKMEEKELQEAMSEFETFLKSLAKQSEKALSLNEETVKNKINQMFETFESRLSDFLVQTEQKSVLSIELELRSVRQLVDTYKAQQLKLIDENIIAILEKTLILVLGKRLPLKDQMDLVYESLEKAKAEKFIV